MYLLALYISTLERRKSGVSKYSTEQRLSWRTRKTQSWKAELERSISAIED